LNVSAAIGTVLFTGLEMMFTMAQGQALTMTCGQRSVLVLPSGARQVSGHTHLADGLHDAGVDVEQVVSLPEPGNMESF
jgi:hypothetical protein